MAKPDEGRKVDGAPIGAARVTLHSSLLQIGLGTNDCGPIRVAVFCIERVLGSVFFRPTVFRICVRRVSK
jgi:hypothetical protein